MIGYVKFSLFPNLNDLSKWLYFNVVMSGKLNCLYLSNYVYTHFVISYQSQGFILLQEIKLRIVYGMKNQIVLCKYMFFYILKSDIIRNSNIFIYMYKSWQETVKYIHPFVIDSRSFTPYLITCHPPPPPPPSKFLIHLDDVYPICINGS